MLTPSGLRANPNRPAFFIDSVGAGDYLRSQCGNMKREIELIMFDLDGTLADTGEDLASAVNHVRTSFSLKPLDPRWINGHVGRGVEYLLRYSLPEKFLDQLDEAMRIFLEHYQEHLLDTTTLYPRAQQTLEYFRDKKRVIVSNKPYHLTVGVLKGLGIEACFDAIIGGDSGPGKKPDPAPVKHVLASFGVVPGKAVMVGDVDTDVEAGKGAGVHTCAVTYGFGKIVELLEARPDFLIDDLWKLTEHFV